MSVSPRVVTGRLPVGVGGTVLKGEFHQHRSVVGRTQNIVIHHDIKGVKTQTGAGNEYVIDCIGFVASHLCNRRALEHSRIG